MGGRLRRWFAAAAASIVVAGAVLTIVSCGNPLTSVLQSLIGGGPDAPVVTGDASPTPQWRPTWSWDWPADTAAFRFSLDTEYDWNSTTDQFWTPDWDLIGYHTLYVQARNAAGLWSTSGSYTLLVDPTWGNSLGGTLTLGDVEALGYSDENPIHSTTISNFWISSYEVTQQFYLAVMGNNPSWHTSANGYTDDPLKPVENVSFQDAIAFCNALSDAYGYTRAYTIIGSTVTWDPYADGFRLPTEAEWEFAARGGTASVGYTYSGSNNIDDVAWYDMNGSSETHPVGGLWSNELGLYDMTGNVWEWCWDNYSSTWYTDNPDWTDPRGPLYNDAYIGMSYSYVVRGGSYYNDWDRARNAFRGYDLDDALYINYGFRIVTNW